MRWGLIVLIALAVFAGRARADAADSAIAAVKTAEQKTHDLAAQKQALAARYQQQLAAIDDLKRQRASWRRDRQLKSALAESLETAKQLAAIASSIDTADAQLARARQTAIAAIDAAPEARRAQLASSRAQIASALAPAHPKKIVLPDDTLDPLADPEELDQQAAALREGESELAREADSLAKQAERFAKQAELLRQHQRADDLAMRDDAEPRRTPGGAGGAANDRANPAPQGSGAPDSLSTPGGGAATSSFEGQPDFVLADVIDSAAIDGLRRAGRGSDPAAKAAAASAARDQVEARLKRLRDRRAAIEARARELRH
ncbi:MAG TPA: hypothetical protein VL463_17890 [Kofleriaceae bacterium]|nr:hypothetical protein [Kofleriaceae bacterium]